MFNRIDLKFQEIRKNKKKDFISFITAGDPNLKTTEKLVLALEKSGVDIIELGVPFSDPLADGPTIQASSERALKNGVNLDQILDMVERIRNVSKIPIALMTYYNPVFHYGEDLFIMKANWVGVDGVIIPDLPPEEARGFIQSAKNANLSTIFFLSPTTIQERLERIVQASTGFIYYVSLTGVTGARQDILNFAIQEIREQVRLAKRMTDKPICVGFGISNAAQVKSISKIADGVIVGSAIVNEIHKNAGKKDLVKNVARFVGELTLQPEGHECPSGRIPPVGLH